VLQYHRTFIALFNFPLNGAAKRSDAPGYFLGEMDPSVFIILKNADPVLRKATGVNLYFIFATHQPSVLGLNAILLPQKRQR